MCRSFACIFALVPLFWASTIGGTYRLVQAFSDQVVSWPSSIVSSSSGDLFVLDNMNHRVLVFREGRFLRQIGQIGQGEGDLHQPVAMCIDKNDRLYIVDQENKRIQIFLSDGSPYGRFQADTETNTITVDSLGEILINNPNSGDLVTVYSAQGRKVRTMGELAPVSLGYPGHARDEDLKPFLGRAYLLADESGIYIVHFFMPLVRKITENGELLWERRLEGKPVEELARTFWGEPGSRPAKSVRSLDHRQFTNIIACAAIAEDGRLLVVLADGTLLALAPDGTPVAQVDLDPPRFDLLGVSNHRGYLYFTTIHWLARSARPLPELMASQ